MPHRAFHQRVLQSREQRAEPSRIGRASDRDKPTKQGEQGRVASEWQARASSSLHSSFLPLSLSSQEERPCCTRAEQALK